MFVFVLFRGIIKMGNPLNRCQDLKTVGFSCQNMSVIMKKLAQLPQELHELLSGRTTYAASGFIQNAALSQGNATSKDKPTDPCLVLQNHTQVGDVLVRPL